MHQTHRVLQDKVLAMRSCRTIWPVSDKSMPLTPVLHLRGGGGGGGFSPPLHYIYKAL